MFLTRRGKVFRYDLEVGRLEAVEADLAEGDVIRDIAAGSDFVYVLLADGTLKCRGKNKCGQLATLDEKERKELAEKTQALPNSWDWRPKGVFSN